MNPSAPGGVHLGIGEDTDMKTILLAIGGENVESDSVRFSLELAWRLKAKLDVLQVLGLRARSGWQRMKSGLSMGRRMFEGGMTAAAYAEAGEPELARRIYRILAEGNQEKRAEDRVEYQVHVLAGRPEQEIVRYLERHHDVVLAVYDGPAKPKGTDLPRRISGAARVPVVTVQRRSATV